MVPIYVPGEYAHMMGAWVRSKTTASRYIPVDRQFTRGTTALGVVDEDHYDKVKFVAVHSLSKYEGVITNDRINIDMWRSRNTMAQSFPLRGDTHDFSEQFTDQAKVETRRRLTSLGLPINRCTPLTRNVSERVE